MKEFISNTIPGPFYGVHLRRTDLTVGLSDLEVFNLAKAHPSTSFFVCSDDPQAERLATGHPNVLRREKKFQVEKKTKVGDWLALTQDDDGRMYFGNIQRNEDAVIEGAIDMLILAHSQIVGFSGSTFQKLAKTIGGIGTISKIKRPNEMHFFSAQEFEKQLNCNSKNIYFVNNIINNMIISGNGFQVSDLLKIASSYFKNEDLIDIYYIVGMDFLNRKDYLLGVLYLEHFLANKKNFAIGWLNLCFGYIKISNLPRASICLEKYIKINQESINNNEKSFFEMLKSKVINEIKD